ncbi:MAG: hypothetical protein JXK07_10205 [Spirochaetes bacterium]|nr:hypothetical protein [Spirochaetota bacterium]
MYQFIIGTDTASIGIWDKKWCDPSIREKSISNFLKRLPIDAEKKQLFYIDTGGDGESSSHVYIEEEFNDNDYKIISDEFVIETTSGECVIDGLEFYGSPPTSTNLNIFPIAPGLYKIKLYVLKDAELEDSKMIQEGEAPPKLFIEKIAFLGIIGLIYSIYLLFRGKYAIGGSLLAALAIYSYFLGKIQEKQKALDKRRIIINVKKPYLVFVMSKNIKDGHKGGWVSILDK